MTEAEKAQNRVKQGEVAYAHLRKVIDALEKENAELKEQLESAAKMFIYEQNANKPLRDKIEELAAELSAIRENLG
jgi:DNA repair exonuclease SbcCD ATPase subunit